MRWVVLLITTFALLTGGCASARARPTDPTSSAQVKHPTPLPAAFATARRDGSVPEVRLPTFTLPAPAFRVARSAVACEPPIVAPRGQGRARPTATIARGPPRG